MLCWDFREEFFNHKKRPQLDPHMLRSSSRHRSRDISETKLQQMQRSLKYANPHLSVFALELLKKELLVFVHKQMIA